METTFTMASVLSEGLELVGSCLSFITTNPILLTGVVIGLASYGIAVVKNAIR